MQLKRWIMSSVIGLACLSAQVSASPIAPVEGTDFQVLSHPLDVPAGKKADVLEVFWYDCPHCFILDPYLAEWVKKQGDKISFHRLHIKWEGRRQTAAQQKAYLALEAMGKADALHADMLKAEQVEHRGLGSDEAIADWVAQHGVNRKAFLDMENSFDMNSRVRKANDTLSKLPIDGVPAIVVGGKYWTAPWLVAKSMPAGTTEQQSSVASLQVVEFLLKKLAQERK